MASSKNVRSVNDLDFEAEVLRAEGPVLVDFTAEWCPPCRALAPVIDRLADENVGKVKVVTVDIDESPVTSNKYGIRGAPTVVVFEGGERRAQHVGATSKAKLLALLGR